MWVLEEKVSVLVEALEGKNRVALHSMTGETFQVSCTLDSQVEELAVKHYAPVGSRVLSEEEIRGWAAQIQSAESAHDCAQEMQAAAKAGSHSLHEVLDECVSKLARGMPRSATNANGM